MINVRYTNEAGYGTQKMFNEATEAWLFIAKIGLEKIHFINICEAYPLGNAMIEETKEWYFEKDICYYSSITDKIYEEEAKEDEFSKIITEHLWNEKKTFNWKRGGF